LSTSKESRFRDLPWAIYVWLAVGAVPAIIGGYWFMRGFAWLATLRLPQSYESAWSQLGEWWWIALASAGIYFVLVLFGGWVGKAITKMRHASSMPDGNDDRLGPKD